MFAELFYPKELKEMVADLRAKDQLDSNALGRMNGYIYRRTFKYFVCALFLVISCFVFAQKASVMISLAFFCVICVILFHFKSVEMRILKFYPILYLKGKTTEGACLELIMKRNPQGPYPMPIGWELKYRFKVNLKEYFASTKIIPWGIVKPVYQKNDAVTVFYDPDNPERSVPYVPALYALFYLKK